MKNKKEQRLNTTHSQITAYVKFDHDNGEMPHDLYDVDVFQVKDHVLEYLNDNLLRHIIIEFIPFNDKGEADHSLYWTQSSGWQIKKESDNGRV